MAPAARRRSRPAAPSTAGGGTFPPVRIESGAAFELIAQLAAFASGPARASLESGKGWIREVRSLAGPELIASVERWGFPVYTELATVALEAGPGPGPAALADRLRELPADALWRRLLGAESPLNRAMLSESAFERAIAGDVRARAELIRTLGLNPPARRGLGHLLSTPAAEVQAQIADVVETWARRVFPAFADQALAGVTRDVAAKARLLEGGPARDALRAAMNGVDFDPTEWATEVVLIPTVALRPFVAPVEAGTTSIVLCPVGDEAFEDGLATPPRRLVRITAALADELRLRILRELADGALTATQLAGRLSIDRTSLHHHLGILRSAGLVTATADGVHSWRYARRTDPIAGISAGLAAYLATPPD